MTFETLMAIFAGGLFLVVCGLITFIFVSLHTKVDEFKVSFDSFRQMLDEKLTQLGIGLTAIDKDLRGEIYILDRRTTRLEAVAGTRKQEADKDCEARG